MIGQARIKREMGLLLPELYRTGGAANILLQGPSGYGKTTLAMHILNYLSPSGVFDTCLGDSFKFNKSRWLHFIDEAHLLDHPEVLYPMMDSGKYVIILASNEVTPLPEALVNRCRRFVLEDYSKEDLYQIIRNLGINLPAEYLDYIILSGGGNPRIIKNTCQRISLLLRSGISFKSFSEFIASLDYYLGIADGLDVQCTKYLETLSSLGGKAGLDTIATVCHLDKGTIRQHVEPILIFRNKIQITSRGRILLKGNKTCQRQK